MATAADAEKPASENKSTFGGLWDTHEKLFDDVYRNLHLLPGLM